MGAASGEVWLQFRPQEPCLAPRTGLAPAVEAGVLWSARRGLSFHHGRFLDPSSMPTLLLRSFIKCLQTSLFETMMLFLVRALGSVGVSVPRSVPENLGLGLRNWCSYSHSSHVVMFSSLFTFSCASGTARRAGTGRPPSVPLLLACRLPAQIRDDHSTTHCLSLVCFSGSISQFKI